MWPDTAASKVKGHRVQGNTDPMPLLCNHLLALSLEWTIGFILHCLIPSHLLCHRLLLSDALHSLVYSLLAFPLVFPLALAFFHRLHLHLHQGLAF